MAWRSFQWIFVLFEWPPPPKEKLNQKWPQTHSVMATTIYKRASYRQSRTRRLKFDLEKQQTQVCTLLVELFNKIKICVVDLVLRLHTMKTANAQNIHLVFAGLVSPVWTEWVLLYIFTMTTP